MGNVAACCTSADTAASAPLSPGPGAAVAAVPSPMPSAAPSTASPRISARPVAQWTVAEVEGWVLAIGLPAEVAGAFRDTDIEGDELLELSRKELEEDVGIQKMGHKKKIMRAVEELKAANGDGGAPDAGASGGAAAAVSGLLGDGGAPPQLAALGGALGGGGFASKLQSKIPSDLTAQLDAAKQSALGGVLGTLGGGGSPSGGDQEEIFPITRTSQGFGLAVMESKPSENDAVVVPGGFCTAVPMVSTHVICV